ncbi:MAG: hypothetical protein WA633_18210 [Stellaceae bacterium]
MSENDPERMNLALANSENAIKYYTGKGESVARWRRYPLFGLPQHADG